MKTVEIIYWVELKLFGERKESIIMKISHIFIYEMSAGWLQKIDECKGHVEACISDLSLVVCSFCGLKTQIWAEALG